MSLCLCDDISKIVSVRGGGELLKSEPRESSSIDEFITHVIPTKDAIGLIFIICVRG